MTLHGIGTDQHPHLGPVRYSVRELGWDPDGQVVQTVQRMRELVAQDSADLQFKARAKGVVNPQGLGMGEDWRTHQGWGHVRGAVQFVRDERIGLRGDGLAVGGGDPNDVVEVLIRPRDMANYIDQGIAIGDCDDFSMYLAALLKANDVDCSFCTVAANSKAPNQYSHVYVVAYPDGERVPCDASHGEYCGWEVENQFGKRTEWPVLDQGRLTGMSLLSTAVVGTALWFGWQWMRRDWI